MTNVLLRLLELAFGAVGFVQSTDTATTNRPDQPGQLPSTSPRSAPPTPLPSTLGFIRLVGPSLARCRAPRALAVPLGRSPARGDRVPRARVPHAVGVGYHWRH